MSSRLGQNALVAKAESRSQHKLEVKKEALLPPRHGIMLHALLEASTACAHHFFKAVLSTPTDCRERNHSVGMHIVWASRALSHAVDNSGHTAWHAYNTNSGKRRGTKGHGRDARLELEGLRGRKEGRKELGAAAAASAIKRMST